MALTRRQFSIMSLSSIILAATPWAGAGAFASVDGVWYYGDQPCHIRVVGPAEVRLRNNEGRRAKGTFEGPWIINVPDWGVTGDIRKNGRVIKWSNGTTWTRFPKEQTHISGKWYHGKSPTRIKVYDNGWRVQITNENGQTSDGRAAGPHAIFIPSLNLTGHVSYSGQVIDWSNGTVWTREPHGGGGGGQGPFTSRAP